MGTFIGIIILMILMIPMVAHYHRKAVQQSYDAACERLKNDPAALKLFKENRWDGR